MHHNIVDGRGVFILLDLFCRFLTRALEGVPEQEVGRDLVWGEEIERLTPPGPFVKALVGTGKPPELSIAAEAQEEVQAPAELSVRSILQRFSNQYI